METEKKLAALQNIYAASVAETVNTYARLNALDAVVERKKANQPASAPYMNNMLGIQSPEDVISCLTSVFGCADWKMEKTANGYEAVASACKLCALSKKMGGADPCKGWCLAPMEAMISAALKNNNKTAEFEIKSTLMEGGCCKLIINIK